MSSCLNRLGRSVLGVAMVAGTLVWSSALVLHAGQSRTVRDGVYTDAQAARGQAIFTEQCASCHGPTLGGASGPPLSGDDFIVNWDKQPLLELASKIQNTMPANAPGQLTRQQTADIVAHILKVGKLPAGTADLGADEAVLKQITWPAGSSQPKPAVLTAGQAPSFPPAGNLAQVMRGILFPSSNLIFNVQTHDPAAPRTGVGVGATTAFSWADWGAGIYTGWELVDYAAVALAESAPLMLTPGRRCENGKPVPVEDAEWIKYSQELADIGRAVYKASQSRNQEAVSEITSQLSDSCMHCHSAYRDKPGARREGPDPSNKAARCVR